MKLNALVQKNLQFGDFEYLYFSIQLQNKVKILMFQKAFVFLLFHFITNFSHHLIRKVIKYFQKSQQLQLIEYLQRKKYF